MYFVAKYQEFRRQQTEKDQKKKAEKELQSLNVKIVSFYKFLFIYFFFLFPNSLKKFPYANKRELVLLRKNYSTE